MPGKKTIITSNRNNEAPLLTVLYEDRDIIVVDKKNGLLTIATEKEKTITAYSLLTDYVKKGNERSKNRVFIVHRLDRDTSGLLVFARNENAKFFLQENWKDFKKKYLAVVCGHVPENEGVITSYLFENNNFRVCSVSDPEKGKFAKTGFRVLKKNEKYSLLEIELFTGRKNQIRVHLADKGFPVAGDKIYGKKDPEIMRLALHSFSLQIVHPHTRKEMTFKTDMPRYFNQLI